MFYAWSPVSVFYSLEGRMYSLVWFLATALAWHTLRLVARRRRGPPALATWLVVAAARSSTPTTSSSSSGSPFGAWLLLWPGRLPRRLRGAPRRRQRRGGLPWYAKVPARPRPLAGDRRLARGAAALARARHPALRAGLEPARGRQPLGRLAAGGRRSRARLSAAWRSGSCAGARCGSCSRPTASWCGSGWRRPCSVPSSSISSATPARPECPATC